MVEGFLPDEVNEDGVRYGLNGRVPLEEFPARSIF